TGRLWALNLQTKSWSTVPIYGDREFSFWRSWKWVLDIDGRVLEISTLDSDPECINTGFYRLRASHRQDLTHASAIARLEEFEVVGRHEQPEEDEDEEEEEEEGNV
ncbi:hypothetical protein PFISCL1PPCAC_4473, partial [Pristionchus fissidentatus]